MHSLMKLLRGPGATGLVRGSRLASPPAGPVEPTETVKIVLVGGQSNASRWMRESVTADYATWPDYIKGADPGTLAAPSPEYFDGAAIQDWDTNDSGQNGMGHYWLTGLSGTGAAFGFQDAAAYYLKQADPDTRYIFVQVSQGGSILGLESIPTNGSWNTDYAAVKAQRANGALLEALELRYADLVTALEGQNIGYTVEAMLFHQGESDGSNATNAANYEANLTDLIASVRTFTGTADLPFLFGTVCTRSTQYNANGDTVRAAMKAVRDSVANTYLRDMEDWAGRPSEGSGVGSGSGGPDSTAAHFGGHTADKFGLWVAKKRDKVPTLPAWNVQHSYSGDRTELLAAFRAQCVEGFDPNVIDVRSVDNLGNALLATLGAQTHPNGKVYFAPDGNSNKIHAFNPATDEVEVAATVSSQSARSGIALAPNGLLVMAPGNSGATENNWLIFNSTDSSIAGVAAGATTTVNTAATNVRSYGSILGSDGYIYAIPRDAGATIRRLDPTTLTESNFPATAPNPGGRWAGGTLSITDGRIYSAPQNADRVLIIDTEAGTTDGSLATSVDGLSLTNGPDGNLYYSPFVSGDQIQKITPGDTPAIEDFGATLSGRHTLTQIGPDGRLYCPPWDSDDNLSSFDAHSGLVLNEVPAGWPNAGPGEKFAAGALTTDGRMVIANKAGGGDRSIIIVGEKRPGALSIDFVCSPYATNW